MAVPLEGKVILDTNVFIDDLRDGLHADLAAGRTAGTVRFLSSVVLFELRMGAKTPRRKRAVDAIKRAFPPGHILAPTAEAFDRAGKPFRSLYGDAETMADRLGATNDLLIALSARAIGATVVTGNVGEFRRIATRLGGLGLRAPLGVL